MSNYPMCGAALTVGSLDCTACAEPVRQPQPVMRFRWHVIPTFFLGLTAGLFLLGGLGQLFIALSLLYGGVAASVVVKQALIGTAAILPAAAWGTAARFWWRGRWRWTVAWTVLGCLAAHVGPWLAGKL